MSVILLRAVSHMKSTEDALLLFAADSHFPVAQWPGFLMGRQESKKKRWPCWEIAMARLEHNTFDCTHPFTWMDTWDMLKHGACSSLILKKAPRLSKSAGKQYGEKACEDLKTGSDSKWQCKFMLFAFSFPLASVFFCIISHYVSKQVLCVMSHVGIGLIESVVRETCWGWAHSQGSAYSSIINKHFPVNLPLHMQWFRPGWLWGAQKVNHTLIPCFLYRFSFNDESSWDGGSPPSPLTGLVHGPVDGRGTSATDFNRVGKLTTCIFTYFFSFVTLSPLAGSERFLSLRPNLYQVKKSSLSELGLGSSPACVCLGDNPWEYQRMPTASQNIQQLPLAV